MSTGTLEHLRSGATLRRFSFFQSLRGAIIYGFIAGGMVALQGLAFAATYTTDLARSGFATTLAANPVLGVLYGEVRNIDMPSGYMAYRTLPVLTLIGALWALSVSTRMLRGQEEDGRLELLLTGEHSLPAATRELIGGLFRSLVVAFGIGAILLVLLGTDHRINVSATASLFFALALFMPALAFMGIGALTSQLASTRRRAMTYGVLFAGICFALRSVGNVIHDVAWLKWFTPFGWADRLHPLTGSAGIWFIPLLTLAVASFGVALYISRKRDLGDSLIADNASAPAHTRFLNGPFGAGFRLNRGSFTGWLVATVCISTIVVALAKTAADALASSSSLTDALGAITRSNSTALAVAFASFGGYLTALLLLLATANGIGRIREDEAKGLADNFLAGPVSRTKWLGLRTLLLALAVSVICTAANLVCWLVARAQGIPADAGSMLVGGLNYIGPAILMLGIGVTLFGILPRLASAILYAWIGWSFLVEMIGSVVSLPDWVYDTSPLRHISMVPAASANWKTFGIVIAIGVATFLAGNALFGRRDIVSE